MEDLYVKPGNQKRGWNDPPQFSYGLQTAQGGPKRNLLNKRVPPPQLHGSQSSDPGTAPPPPTFSAPPSKPLAPPPCGATMSPQAFPEKPQSDISPSLSKIEPSIDDITALLNWALTACRHTVKKQVCDDVDRRLKLFEDMWRREKLSLPVRRRMGALAHEIKNHNWDSADKIHRALIVDYASEVSQWMVGVKRLIAETRNLSPELLKVEVLDQNLELNQEEQTAAK